MARARRNLSNHLERGYQASRNGGLLLALWRVLLPITEPSCSHNDNSPMWEDGGLKSPPVVPDWPCGPLPRSIICRTLRCAPVQSALDSAYLLEFPFLVELLLLSVLVPQGTMHGPHSWLHKPRTSGLPTSPSQPVPLPELKLIIQNLNTTCHKYPTNHVPLTTSPMSLPDAPTDYSSSGFSLLT